MFSNDFETDLKKGNQLCNRSIVEHEDKVDYAFEQFGVAFHKQRQTEAVQ